MSYTCLWIAPTHYARKSYLVLRRLCIKITKIVKHSLFNLMALTCDHKKIRCWLEEFVSSAAEGRKSLLGFSLDLSAFAINFCPFTFIFLLSRFCADNRFFLCVWLTQPSWTGCRSSCVGCLQCKHVSCVYTSQKNNWSGLRDLCCGKCLLVHTRHHHRHSQSPIDWCSWEFYGLLFISIHLSNFTHISRSHATVNDDEWCWLIFLFTLPLSLTLGSWTLLFYFFFRGVILLKCYQWCVAIHYSFSRQSTLPVSACLWFFFVSSIQSLALAFDVTHYSHFR